MSIIKRAWYYVTRKKSKSLLMFLILFGIATATISGIAIKKATVDTRDQINQSMNAGFRLKGNLLNNPGIGGRGFGNVPASAIDQIKGIEGVAKYNARIIGEVDLVDLKKVKLTNPRIQQDDSIMKGYESFSSLDGMTDSSLDNKFISGVLTLTEGRHITKEDKQKVLVNEEFAKLNHLKLHDKIYVKASELASIRPSEGGSNEQIPLEIVGLVSGSNMNSATMESELVENAIITDIQTIMMLNGYDDKTALYQEVKFYVNDPKELPGVLKKVHELPIDWSNYVIENSSSDYPALTGSLDSMDGLINKMLIGIVVVSAIILSLVLAFWINGRIHETGVLLSLGVSKISIITQYVVELLFIAVVSFGLSYFSGQAIAQNIGDSMVQQANEAGTMNLQQSLGGMQLGADPDTSTVSKTLDGIDVSITLAEMGYVWLIGGLIILLSVCISSIFIIRLKPKEILSKMS
ncbi:FtsX-like permease family protein [Paenibacillus sp. LHD-38]|uniref:ABC transporter permease n=1 Tax=Paenibacillus sp. LHD-38 TaxID=3072143 RepID=UPI00280CD550|nr:FtsX-like permease family protein [Paenibacillus sp. LHD-38]MDQ8735193.1 FtsX-like permease family protein [Paenibacillus sp. LHD-38]